MSTSTYDGRLAVALAAIEERKSDLRRAKTNRPATTALRRKSVRDTQQELVHFMELWSLSLEQTVAALVYLRLWLHNLGLNLQTMSRADEHDRLEGSRVVRHYSSWLDGIPEVRARLPSAVLNRLPVRVCADSLEYQACTPVQVDAVPQNNRPANVSIAVASRSRRPERGHYFTKNPGSYEEASSPKKLKQFIRSQVNPLQGRQ